MKYNKFRFSLLSLLIFTTIIGLLCGLLTQTNIGYRAYNPVAIRSGPTYSTFVRYGYRQDTLGLKDNKLDYVVIIPFQTGTPIDVALKRKLTLLQNTTILEIDGRVIELPKHIQLFEYENERLITFRERVTYSQWIDFKSQQSGTYRIEDLLQFVAE